MKRVLFFSLTILIALAVALAWSFTPASFDVGQAIRTQPLPAAARTAPDIAVLHTGTMEARAAFSFRGGSFSDKRAFVMPALLIRHPEGNLLVDTGLGRRALDHLAGEPWLMRALSRAQPSTPAAEQLGGEVMIDAIVLTHAHWDHVSGIEDFPGIPVHVSAAEVDFIQSGEQAGRLAREIVRDNQTTLVPITFPDGPFMGLPASNDHFGDGSVVIVPAPGHTPGSIWIFVTTANGQRLLLVGDTVWQHEGYEIPAEKPWLARRRVDFDPAATREAIARLHHIANAGTWHILPAHDRQAWLAVTDF